MSRVLIVPAAGRGSRLGSSLPKPLVAVDGRPMIDHVLDVHGAVDAAFVVAAPDAADAVRRHLAGRRGVEVVVQATPTGMLDAILVPRDDVARLGPGEVWITWCDQVAVRPETVARLSAAMAAAPPPSLAFPTVESDLPYIHFARGGDGRISGVLQRREGHAMPARGEGDMGLFALSGEVYLERLSAWRAEAPRGERTGERNFLPFIPWLARRASVVTIPATDPIEAVGINTPQDLERVTAHLRRRRSSG